MATSCFELIPTTVRSITSFDPNKPVSLFLKVANPGAEFEGHPGRRTAAPTPTTSSSQPQPAAMTARVTQVLLGTLVVGPQVTTYCLNISPPSIVSPANACQCQFHPSPLYSWRWTHHMAVDPSNIPVPSFHLIRLFHFMAVFHTIGFGIVFNISVILCLLYLFFASPVSESPPLPNSLRTLTNFARRLDRG